MVFLIMINPVVFYIDKKQENILGSKEKCVICNEKIELANTKHNFFSQHVWNDAMIRVIDKKIRQEEDEIISLKKIATNLF